MYTAQECIRVRTVGDAKVDYLLKQRKMHQKAKRSNLKADWDNFCIFRSVISRVKSVNFMTSTGINGMRFHK